ncbi:MAG: hypothetical protein ACRDKW_00800 [Actinomycetota bacterium]
MTGARGRSRKATSGRTAVRPSSVLVFAFLLALSVVGFGPGTADAAGGDPDDMAVGLDIRSVAERVDSATVTLTVEAYEAFADQDVDVTWAVDVNGDGAIDVRIAAEWGPGLTGEIEDAAEREMGEARVSRPAPNAVAVSFPVSVVGGTCSCRYNVVAVTDFNGNGETEAGEADVAPDAGFYGWP